MFCLGMFLFWYATHLFKLNKTDYGLTCFDQLPRTHKLKFD